MPSKGTTQLEGSKSYSGDPPRTLITWVQRNQLVSHTAFNAGVTFPQKRHHLQLPPTLLPHLSVKTTDNCTVSGHRTCPSETHQKVLGPVAVILRHRSQASTFQLWPRSLTQSCLGQARPGHQNPLQPTCSLLLLNALPNFNFKWNQCCHFYCCCPLPVGVNKKQHIT